MIKYGKEIELIKINSEGQQDSFLDDLSNNCKFSKEKYNELVFSIYNLNESDIKEDSRLSISVKIWEICFNTLFILMCDKDPNDGVRMHIPHDSATKVYEYPSLGFKGENFQINFS